MHFDNRLSNVYLRLNTFAIKNILRAIRTSFLYRDHLVLDSYLSLFICVTWVKRPAYRSFWYRTHTATRAVAVI